MATVLKLNNGGTMPAVGLGTISFNESDEKIKFAIVTAIRVISISSLACDLLAYSDVVGEVLYLIITKRKSFSTEMISVSI